MLCVAFDPQKLREMVDDASVESEFWSFSAISVFPLRFARVLPKLWDQGFSSIPALFRAFCGRCVAGGRGNRIFSPRSVDSPSPLEVVFPLRFARVLPKLWDQGFSSIPALFRAFCGRCVDDASVESEFWSFSAISVFPLRFARVLPKLWDQGFSSIPALFRAFCGRWVDDASVESEFWSFSAISVFPLRFARVLPKLWDQGFSSIPALFRAFCGRCVAGGRGNRIFSPRSVDSPSPLEVVFPLRFARVLPKLWDQGFSSIPALFRAFCGRCVDDASVESEFWSFSAISVFPLRFARVLPKLWDQGFSSIPAFIPRILREMGGRRQCRI